MATCDLIANVSLTTTLPLSAVYFKAGWTLSRSIKTASVWTGLSSGAFSKYLTVSTYVKGAFYLGDHCHARVEAHFG